jgi:hypothetical protein
MNYNPVCTRVYTSHWKERMIYEEQETARIGAIHDRQERIGAQHDF